MGTRDEAVRWAKVAGLAGILLGAYGIVINDEAEQANALHNLANGSFLIREHPEEFFPKVANLTKALRYPGPEPVGSTLLNHMALPMVLVVRGADALAPLGVWWSAAAAALGWSLFPRPLRSRPSVVASAVLAAAILAKGFRMPEPDLSPYEVIVALQATNLLVLAVAAAFVAAAIRRHAHGLAADVAVAATMVGSLLFWGSKIKYTILAAALTAVALWLAGQPASTRRSMALAAVAAFAVWNNIGPGSVVALAVGILLIGDLGRSGWSRNGWKSFGAAVAEGLVCLVPWGLENAIATGNPLVPPYLALDQRSSEPPPLGGLFGVAYQVVHSALAPAIWEGPANWLGNFGGAWTSGYGLEGPALGVFALSPLLALSVWTLARRGWRGRADLGLATLLVAFQVLLLTNRVAHQGWGLDARLIAPTLPAVGLLAAPAIQRILADGQVRGKVVWATAVLGGAALLVGVLAVIIWVLPYGLRQSHLVQDVLELASLATVAGVGLAVLATRMKGQTTPAVRAVCVGALLAIPLLWTATASIGASSVPAEDGGRASAFVPLVDELRYALGPHLNRPYPLPVVVENNVTVFHPDYGNCNTQPSPCPWWGPTMTNP